MTINEAMRTYRLPSTTTPEELECHWSKVLTFGNKILLAGHFYNGKNKPSYFGATYEFTGDDHTCEGARLDLRQQVRLNSWTMATQSLGR